MSMEEVLILLHNPKRCKIPYAASLESQTVLSSLWPRQNPLEVLQKTPEVLYSLGGEGDMTDSAEYGELSTNL